MAEGQFPLPDGAPRWARTMIQSMIAPEVMRTAVNVAGSMLVCLSAMRHNRELSANATIAKSVKAMSRIVGIYLGCAERAFAFF